MIRLTDEEKDQILNMATNVTNPMPLSEVVRYGNAIAQTQHIADQLRKGEGG